MSSRSKTIKARWRSSRAGLSLKGWARYQIDTSGPHRGLAADWLRAKRGTGASVSTSDTHHQ